LEQIKITVPHKTRKRLKHGRRNAMSEKIHPEKIAIHGYVKGGFESVQEAFSENFTRRDELGAACSIFYHGEKVVDLWGGIRDKATGEPWEENTMVLVHSTTKGMSGLALRAAFMGAIGQPITQAGGAG
jgi:hypothetical protein